MAHGDKPQAEVDPALFSELETLVLTHMGDDGKIVHVHWSSK
ncbi:hypothetical protein [Microbulbifer sp. HZ11]|nr:hypothetical protein [Microbulbifer sp. HZ11]